MSGTETDGSGKVGQQGLNADTSQFNIHDFFIQQALGKVGTVKLVKVIAVENAGEVAAVGFVDVKIMVNLVDGLLGSAMPHDTVFQLPYFRLQGGLNAVIMDPVVGDIGFAVICDRDISAVKSTKDYAPPGSYRRFSISDGLYIGGVLNDTPQQYITFTSAGIKIADKNSNVWEMKSGTIELTTTTFKVNGDIKATGEVVGKMNTQNIHLTTHVHSANNTPPTANS